ncbi:MAG TPA: prepilin-type N-terminal cleavage/methylation domain-containing protein [Chthoniobacteraceae bacterium]|jgi:prepilin-type N-terminal cleavage/methylation domain-containing protein|nr:prepilin-type N-terminal cleavage/methylation domain-containing protein [Chthoniobacteraceae bacterium]
MAEARAFTLVEMILVMALLCVIVGLATPALTRSMRARTLGQEAARLLGVIDYARDEAASQGVPMDVWVDSQSGTYGARAKAGYEDAGTQPKDFKLERGLKFSTVGTGKPLVDGTFAVEVAPDGTLDPSSQQDIRLEDEQAHDTLDVVQTSDGGDYEIQKDTTTNAAPMLHR